MSTSESETNNLAGLIAEAVYKAFKALSLEDVRGRITDPADGRLKQLEKENAELRKRLTVDEDMVERAAQALCWGENATTADYAEWNSLTERFRNHCRVDARCILDAALGTGEDS